MWNTTPIRKGFRDAPTPYAPRHPQPPQATGVGGIGGSRIAIATFTRLRPPAQCARISPVFTAGGY